MVVVSKREKNNVHFAKIKETFEKYNQVVVFEMDSVRTRTLHSIREEIRDSSKIIFGKKTVIKKALKDVNGQFLNSLTANTFLVFTNEDIDKIVGVVTKYNIEKSVKVLSKGVLKIKDAPVPTVLRKNLELLNLTTKEKNGVLVLEKDVELDEVKDKKLIRLLKMDDLSVCLKPLCIIKEGNYQKI